jgi:hypothetical protein
MASIPIYEERLKANSQLIIGVSLWALAVGIIPGIILGGLWWLFALYIALTIVIIFGFYQMKVELFVDKLVIKFGFLYRKVIELERIQGYSPHRMLHPMKTYGGWGIRKGRDGTFALTQAFINEAIKLETPAQTFIISSRAPENFCSAIKSLKG